MAAILLPVQFNGPKDGGGTLNESFKKACLCAYKKLEFEGEKKILLEKVFWYVGFWAES